MRGLRGPRSSEPASLPCLGPRAWLLLLKPIAVKRLQGPSRRAPPSLLEGISVSIRAMTATPQVLIRPLPINIKHFTPTLLALEAIIMIVLRIGSLYLFPDVNDGARPRVRAFSFPCPSTLDLFPLLRTRSSPKKKNHNINARRRFFRARHPDEPFRWHERSPTHMPNHEGIQVHAKSVRRVESSRVKPSSHPSKPQDKFINHERGSIVVVPHHGKNNSQPRMLDFTESVRRSETNSLVFNFHDGQQSPLL